MSLLELPAPEILSVDPGDDVHIYCCNPNKALCQSDLTGRPCLGADTPATCATCVEPDELDVRCGALFCRTRQKLRGER